MAAKAGTKIKSLAGETWDSLMSIDIDEYFVKMAAAVLICVAGSISIALLIYDNTAIKDWKAITGEVYASEFTPAHTHTNCTSKGCTTTHHSAFYTVKASAFVNKQLMGVSRDQDGPDTVGRLAALKVGHRPLSKSVIVGWNE